MYPSGTQTTMQFALEEPDEGDDHSVFVDASPMLNRVCLEQSG
jgi:hypothetical protein